MSGSRLTRKVTVESSQKISDSSAPRKSVFDRLGPGTVERTQTRREDYHEPKVEKCRHWLRDGRCPFGSKCRYNHGSTSEAKSKLKIIRSIVSRQVDGSGENKSDLKVKRIHDQEESASEQSSKKSTKKQKSEKTKTSKTHVKEGNNIKESRVQRKDKEDTKVEKKKEAAAVTVRRSTSSSGWNLHPDQSESDDGNDGKQLDWEERGALNYERDVALEERRNDLRRQIAKMDESVEPVVTIANKIDIPVVHSQVIRAVEQESSPPFHDDDDDGKPEKKKKTKSEKSKKKSKKKSHKSDSPQMQVEHLRRENEPSVGKKKRKQDSHINSDPEIATTEVPIKKQEYQKEISLLGQMQTRRGDVSRSATVKEQKSKTLHFYEPSREKDPRQSRSEQSERHFEESIPQMYRESDRQREREFKSESIDEGRNKEKERTKKRSQHLSPPREGKEVVYRKEKVTEARKFEARSYPVEDKQEKRKIKNKESLRPMDEDLNKAAKTTVRHEERKGKGPRTPSPEIKRQIASRDAGRDSKNETSVKFTRRHGNEIEEAASSIVSSKNVNVRHSPHQPPNSRPSKASKDERQMDEPEASENLSESSDSESSSSEDSAEVESVSGEEHRNEGGGIVSQNREVQMKVTEHSKHEQRDERREDMIQNRSDYPDHEERHVGDSRERPLEDPRERPSNESRERPLKDPRERPLNESRERPLNESKERPLNESRERPSNESKERPLNESRERPLNESRERPLNESRERPLNESRERPLNESRERPLHETRERQSNEPRERPSNEPRERPSNEPRERSTNESRERPLIESRERPLNESRERPLNESRERPLIESRERPLNESRERPLIESRERPLIESRERPFNESRERPSNDPRERLLNESRERSLNEFREHSLDEPRERPLNESRERPSKERPLNEPKERPSNESRERSLNEFREHSLDEPRERPLNESRERPSKERPLNEPKERPSNESRERPSRERPLNEPKERMLDERSDPKERPSQYDRHEERGERYHRERGRDHRRQRDEDFERRMDNRGLKDTREIRDSRDIRDHKDTRDHRETPRVDHRNVRDRERNEFDERERERHLPVDVRRNEVPSRARDYDDPPEYGGGVWGRERHIRGHSGYGSYDGRGKDFEDRRTEGRPGQDDREREHIARGSRYREGNERHGAPGQERKVERGTREPERERPRFPETRERFHEDLRGPRIKRPLRTSPEGNRNDRRGYREEPERRPSPPEESEEWDYEEGHSPSAHTKEQAQPSRKRPKEHSSPRSPRSEAPKRKKVASPAQVSQDLPRSREKMPAAVNEQAIDPKESEKQHEKDGKKTKKDKIKKTKKRKLSENEAEAIESVDTPERKRKREAEENSREKQVKKQKTKNQTEVIVRPWSDLENDADVSKGEGKSEKEGHKTAQEEARVTEKGGEEKKNVEVFSDWSDASENAVLTKADTAESKEMTENAPGFEADGKDDKQDKTTDHDTSLDDVYDPISDDEFEAMFAGDEEETVIKKKTTPLPVDEVDWSILGSSVTNKESEPGDYIKRFSAGKVFSRIGLSSALAGAALTKLVQEKCAKDAPHMKMKDLLPNPTGKKFTLGALVAAEARKIKERSNVVSDIGPCRRALCARRDFYIRKQLRKLTTTKLGAKLVLSNSAVDPVDNELFSMSVALFRRQKTEFEQECKVRSPVLPKHSDALVC